MWIRYEQRQVTQHAVEVDCPRSAPHVKPETARSMAGLHQNQDKRRAEMPQKRPPVTDAKLCIIY